MISAQEASAKIQLEFPELTEDTDDFEGLFHLQIHEFCRFTQAAIDEGDRLKLAKIYELFRVLFMNGSPEVINALNVSYLEHLNLSDGKKKRAWAYTAMPPLMKKAYVQMAEYNRKLHAKR